MPIVIHSLGAVLPSRPNADAGTIVGMEESPDCKFLATAAGSEDHWELRLWHAEGEVWKFTALRTPEVRCLSFSGDSKRIALGGSKNFLGVYDIGAEGELIEVPVHIDAGLNLSTRAVALSPEGRWLAAGGTGGHAIRVWDLESNQMSI